MKKKKTPGPPPAFIEAANKLANWHLVKQIAKNIGLPLIYTADDRKTERKMWDQLRAHANPGQDPKLRRLIREMVKDQLYPERWEKIPSPHPTRPAKARQR